LLHGRHETKKRPRFTALVKGLGEEDGDTDAACDAGGLGCSLKDTKKRPFFSLKGIL
jgi:hypothetical protein